MPVTLASLRLLLDFFVRGFARGVLALALSAFALPACAQTERPGSAEGGADRSARIAQNLELEIPALRGSGVEVTELAPSDVPGLDRGTFTVNGQSYTFLVTNDDTRLFILAANPVDVSRTPEEVAAAFSAMDEQATHETADRANALIAATQDLPSRGRPDAPVTIVEFSDFQCSYCRRAAGTLEDLLNRYPEDVRLVYAHFPLGNHAWARPAAIAATCAGRQDEAAFWMLHDLYFEEQGTITRGNVMERTGRALLESGVDYESWATCAIDTTSTAYAEAERSVEASIALGERYGIRGTPAFFVNGEFLGGAQPLDAFVEAVEAALEGGN